MKKSGVSPSTAEPRPKAMWYRLLRAITPVRAAVGFGREQLARYRLQTWRLEGRERVSGMPLVIVFAGQLENKNYLAHLAFADFVADQALGRRWLWTLLPSKAKRESEGIDLQIVELGESQRLSYRARFQFFVPIWIGGELDIQMAVTRLHRSKNARKDLKRMRKADTSYEVTRNRDEFEYFYSNMYFPYIKNRYDNHAFLMSREDMMEKLGCSELTFVKVGGERVAGHILLFEGDNVRAWSVGVKDGDRSYVQAGAIKALHYFTSQYLHERGYKSLHMGGSRPFLLDGVLRHKRELGVRVCDHTKRYFSMSLSAGSAGARAFVVNNPFIYENDGVYRGALFVEPDLPLSQERLREFNDDYCINGLAGLSLFDVRAGGEKQLAQISADSMSDD